MKTKHGIALNAQKRQNENVGTSSGLKQKSIVQSFKKKKSLSEEIARLAAKDGISYQTIENSEFIQTSLRNMGYTFPKGHGKAAKEVEKFCIEAKSIVKKKIEKRKNQGEKFCLSTDEYTSLRNRRYININVHATGGVHYNLGLIRVVGSMPAEKMVQAIEIKLKEFDLDSSKDILCTVNDGASVMLKLGRLIPGEQQLCNAHALHLAVCDVIYKAGDPLDEDRSIEDVEHNVDETGDEDLDDIETLDGVEDFNLLEVVGVNDDCSTIDGILNGDIDSSAPLPILREQFSVIINKVRKLVKIFRKSPVQNDKLQNM